MKKLIALILTLTLAVSMVACGGNTDATGGDDTANNGQVTENTDNTADDALFDSSWTDNEYEKLIPQPPFEGWTGRVKDNNYEMFTTEANIDGTGNYYNVFAEYYDYLVELGFHTTVINDIDGRPYDFDAMDNRGNYFNFKCGDGCAWITIVLN